VGAPQGDVYGRREVEMSSSEAAATDGEDKLSTDTKYASYVSLYCNLDNLLWKNLGNSLVITILGAGVLGTLTAKNNDIAIWRLSHSDTIAAGFFVLSVFYFVTAYTSSRMRMHHQIMDLQLAQLEKTGYFKIREETIKVWHESAVFWVIWLLRCLGFFCLVFMIAYWAD
jgi:hypothetical protein